MLVKKMVSHIKKKKARSRLYPAKIITDADYADDLAWFANTPAQAKSLLHCQELTARGIGFFMHSNKTVLFHKMTNLWN